MKVLPLLFVKEDNKLKANIRLSQWIDVEVRISPYVLNGDVNLWKVEFRTKSAGDHPFICNPGMNEPEAQKGFSTEESAVTWAQSFYKARMESLLEEILHDVKSIIGEVK